MSESSILHRPAAALLAVFALSAGFYLAEQWGWIGSPPRPDLLEALAAERTKDGKTIVESRGTALELLRDKTASGHEQEWIVKVHGARPLIVSHNLDIAARVPVQVGDEIEFRGEFEWNERGGVVHSTHRDPSGNGAGGWIRLRGKTYW